jgi:hypothetical protein
VVGVGGSQVSGGSREMLDGGGGLLGGDPLLIACSGDRISQCAAGTTPMALVGMLVLWCRALCMLVSFAGVTGTLHDSGAFCTGCVCVCVWGGSCAWADLSDQLTSVVGDLYFTKMRVPSPPGPNIRWLDSGIAWGVM